MLDQENEETLRLTDLPAIKAAWAEWEAASAATEAAWQIERHIRLYPTGKSKAARREQMLRAHGAWLATLDRTDAARKAVAGLPSLEDVAEFEARQAQRQAENDRQWSLL